LKTNLARSLDFSPYQTASSVAPGYHERPTEGLFERLAKVLGKQKIKGRDEMRNDQTKRK
jgi:hypothetical protein